MSGGECAQGVDEIGDFQREDLQRLAQQEDIGIVDDVHGSGAQVDDGFGLGRGLGEGVQVGHEIVADAGFLPGGLVEVDVIEMGAHVGDLVIGDGQAQRFFRLGQRQPDAPPGGMLALRRKDGDHLRGGVARHQRRFVHVVA